MAQYYKTRALRTLLPMNTGSHDEAPQARVLLEFYKLRETLLTDDTKEGWAPELWRYLGTMQRDVAKETDLVKWWQVRNSVDLFLSFTDHFLS